MDGRIADSSADRAAAGARSPTRCGWRGKPIRRSKSMKTITVTFRFTDSAKVAITAEGQWEILER